MEQTRVTPSLKSRIGRVWRTAKTLMLAAILVPLGCLGLLVVCGAFLAVRSGMRTKVISPPPRIESTMHVPVKTPEPSVPSPAGKPAPVVQVAAPDIEIKSEPIPTALAQASPAEALDPEPAPDPAIFEQRREPIPEPPSTGHTVFAIAKKDGRIGCEVGDRIRIIIPGEKARDSEIEVDGPEELKPSGRAKATAEKGSGHPDSAAIYFLALAQGEFSVSLTPYAEGSDPEQENQISMTVRVRRATRVASTPLTRSTAPAPVERRQTRTEVAEVPQHVPTTGSRGSGGSVQVRGYYRKNGTYVHSHTRRR